MSEVHQPECTPAELSDKLSRSGDLLVLDVRTPEEVYLAALDGPVVYMPLHVLPDHLEELAPYRDREIVVVCHHGLRSASAVRYLAEHGFARAYNLSGGIDAWSRDVDPDVPRY